MPRLRTVSARDAGWTRVRHGRGFRYLDQAGRPLAPADRERVKALVIPPAWRDVWICPYPNGHLQAVGTDEAGRRQYLYHPVWREQRDRAKFDRALEMARKLPRVRRLIRADLSEASTRRESTLAAALRMVDLGCFRLGSDTYTTQHGSYGLTTLERRHVTRSPQGFVFSFTGKSGVEHDILLDDPLLADVLDLLTRRRSPSARLLSYREGRRWVPLQPGDVNEYIRELFDLEVTAKDFRTWHATVHVAAALADAPAGSKRARAGAVRAAVVSASELLGNTPTVCRSSYVDPRVIDLYDEGVTIAPTLHALDRHPDVARDQLDRAVVDLLAEGSSARQAA